uniref:ETS-related transcription factor Elf-2-like n=1 Tax=Stegastes partitus TaxID=144197 RepID=A0A3B5A085_9TELE
MTSVVLVDTGGTVCEAEEACEDTQEREEADDYPAVIVEELPGASLAEEQGYSAQVVVYENEAYLMQEVADEQEVETEGEAGEAQIF